MERLQNKGRLSVPLIGLINLDKTDVFSDSSSESQDQNEERAKTSKTFTKKVLFVFVAEPAHTYNLQHPVKPQASLIGGNSLELIEYAYTEVDSLTF